MNLEIEVDAVLSALRDEVCTTTKQNAAWDWAEDVCRRFVVDEAEQEWVDDGVTLRSYIASDMAYRLGEQYQDMAKDARRFKDPVDRADISLAKPAMIIAERLLEIAKNS